MISNKFNDFCVNGVQNLARSTPSSCKEPSDYISYKAINAFYFVPVAENEISKIIGCFKEIAAGWGGIKANVIKHITNIVCIPLKHIWNLSLSLGVFPMSWKLEMLFQFIKPMMTWCSPIIGLCLYYLFFQAIGTTSL